MRVLEGYGPNRRKVVISLCDYSGNWPRPWHQAGHTVLLYDLKYGDDVTKLTRAAVGFDIWNTIHPLGDGSGIEVRCVLAAPLCTTFTSSGAKHWKTHEENGTTAECVALADACLNIVEILKPRIWALENPRGRIEKLVPRLAGRKRIEFHPFHYAYLADDPVAEAYTKRTGLWGEFNWRKLQALADHNAKPVMYERGGKRGSWMWAKLGGKSERTKELRSRTPTGFARAFYSASASG